MNIVLLKFKDNIGISLFKQKKYIYYFSKNEQSVGFDISYLPKLSNTKDR
jgi:hypothetical protein